MRITGVRGRSREIAYTDEHGLRVLQNVFSADDLAPWDWDDVIVAGGGQRPSPQPGITRGVRNRHA